MCIHYRGAILLVQLSAGDLDFDGLGLFFRGAALG
jgi:hypothetical protein